jgi:hypothetical protein
VSGNPESKNHSETKWISEDDLRSLPESEFIPGLKDEFVDFIDRFKKLQSQGDAIRL